MRKGPADKARRLEAQKSFQAHCEIYHSEDFSLEFSPNHLTAINKIEAAVFRGEKFAFAMPRGSGKSTLSITSVEWASLHGLSPYSLLINATNLMTTRRLDNFKRTMYTNPLLLEDFPEILLFIKHIENQSAKARGQKFNGEPTYINWGQNRVVYPHWNLDFESLPETYDIEGESVEFKKADRREMMAAYEGLGLGLGAVVDVASIEGEIRGRNYSKPGGGIVRPTYVICDDPQTAESAKSLGQVEDRERKLSNDIKFLKGPDTPMGIVIPCTVIYEGDLADRFLNRDLHPEYRGEKSRMINQFPTDFLDDPDNCKQRKYWDQYRQKFVSDLSADPVGTSANEFYHSNRTVMDDGFEVSWPQRFDTGELSAVQHAMNLFYSDEAAFWAEAQNNPGRLAEGEAKRITADDILAKQHKLDRKKIPLDADGIIAFIDISEKCFWWCVCAYQKSDFRVWVIDFGTTPGQSTDYYGLRSLRATFQKMKKHKGKRFDEILDEELNGLINRIASKSYSTESGKEIFVDAIGVDSGWGEYSTNVYQIVRRNPNKNILHATKGVGITASGRPLVDPEAKRKKGVREAPLGQWKITRTKIKTPLLQYDTNFWKSRAATFFTSTNGGLSVFRASERVLRVFADQCSAETCDREKHRNGREVDIWTCPPGTDNHFFDCIVGCLCLCHVAGARLKVRGEAKKVKQTKYNKQLKQTGKKNQTRSGYSISASPLISTGYSVSY